MITWISNIYRNESSSCKVKPLNINIPIKTKRNYFQQNTNNNSFSLNNVSFEMSASLIGKHFDNIGIIIAQPKLLNIKTNKIIPCDIIHSSTQNGGTIHLIKENNSLIKKVQELFKASPEILEAIKARCGCVMTPAVEKIIEKNKKLATILKQSIIAEISYIKLSSEDDLKRVAKLGYEKIDKDKDIIFLQNLIVNKAEYKNAVKTVTIPLFKGLMEKGLKNILIKASAFGDNPKSPIHLYETYGFKPLGTTEEEIKKHTVQTIKGSRLDPNYRIMMYLPQNTELYSILNKIPPLEITKTNPDWLKI